MYLPINVNLNDKKIVIFGGGRVAHRKCQVLLPLSKEVNVISIDFVEEFMDLKETYPNSLELIKDKYQEKYLLDCHLVVAATDNREVNVSIYNQCSQMKLLCNVVDDGDSSDFIFPSVLRRGDLTISVSTSGKSPGLSRKIKNELGQIYTEDWAEIVDLLGMIREKILRSDIGEEKKKRILKESLDKSLAQLKEIYNRLD